MIKSSEKNKLRLKAPDLKAPSVLVENLGCKVNRYESDAILQQFLMRGFSAAKRPEEADLYILNTCGVTNEAARKSRQLLHRAKRRNPGALVVAVGCQAELTPDELPADLAVGNERKHCLPDVIEAFLADEVQPDRVDIAEVKDFAEFGAVTRQRETRAYLKVQDGCNNFCSYCTIPLARGRVRSRAEEDILREAELLGEAGYKEVVLTGIHVCSYGLDRGESSTALVDLIEKISRTEGIKRIRLSSLEPQSITEEFVDRASKIEKLCPHFHLSLQSGSDKILKAMRRRYDSAAYRRACGYIREAFPEAGLTTDVIVGFPGETEEDFKASYELCRELQLSRLHVFRYSERPGTAAVRFKNKVSGRTAKARSEKLIALGEELAREAMHKALGRHSELLLEDLSEAGYRQGYTPDYLPCELRLPPEKCSAYKEGDLVKVRLNEVLNDRIAAEIDASL